VRSLLARIRELADLQCLVRVASHEIAFQELAPDRWAVLPAPARAALLGGHAGFEWLGFEVIGSAPALASRLAHRLERGGRLAAIAALDPVHRVLALSVSFGSQPLLIIDLERPSVLALRCLERFAGAARDGAVGAAAHLAQALDGEAVGRKFFLSFRSTLDRMARALPCRLPPADRQGVALLQLTRVLFLYFIQARGWLAGRAAFLREEVDNCLSAGRAVHRDLLRPLFFGTLNQPLDHRGAVARRFGAIPFLNGGLFEPHPLERRWRVDIPSPVWRDAFDELFERFHFTPGESDGETIAPDTLGRVFEGVMSADERTHSGTFYTPATLVEAVVRAGLAAALGRRLGTGDGEADRRLADPDPEARAVLENITVLDPAVGSGAFLLGALEVLASALGPGDPLVRSRILSRNLYGVDVNPAAVRLAELRLWLSLIAHEQAAQPDQVAALPNLDAFVRQGDSLLDPLLPAWSTPRGQSGTDLRTLRDRLHRATGRPKAEAMRRLRQAEAAALESTLRSAEQTLTGCITDLLAQARSATLFGVPRGLERRDRQALAELRGRRRFLWRLRRRLEREGALPWFHFQSQFAEVFADRGGFDLVVGNPPWVRAEHLPPPLRRHLAARYRWWRSLGTGSGYPHQPDLAVAFLERGFELTAPAGAVAFLIPAKFATAGYAATARAALSARATFHALADLAEDPRAVFDATVYPMALVASRSTAPPGHRTRLRLEPSAPAEYPQERLGQGPWILAGDRVVNALGHLRADHPVLGARLHCHLGVKTGLNDVFLDPEDPVEPELLCWAIRGRDVRAFSTVPTRRLLWTHAFRGDPLRHLPPQATRYLAKHHARLVARRDFEGGPPWTVFRVGPATAPHRVIWADLAPRLQAAPLSGPSADRLIPLNSCYVCPVPDAATAHRLSAWLNCTWIRAVAALTSDPASGGFRRFNARVVGEVPLPEGVLSDRTLQSLAQSGRAGTLSQESLDDHCNRYLGLAATDRDALTGVVGRRGGGR
jgi:hypothetical protein